MQVGPARGNGHPCAARVGRARANWKLPSLALGTNPVTLREMVATSTIANAGRYVRPILITSIEDRHGRCCRPLPARASGHALQAAQTLRNAMRGTHRPGHGFRLRSRYGLRADRRAKPAPRKTTPTAGSFALHPRW